MHIACDSYKFIFFIWFATAPTSSEFKNFFGWKKNENNILDNFASGGIKVPFFQNCKIANARGT